MKLKENKIHMTLDEFGLIKQFFSRILQSKIAEDDITGYYPTVRYGTSTGTCTIESPYRTDEFDYGIHLFFLKMTICKFVCKCYLQCDHIIILLHTNYTEQELSMYRHVFIWCHVIFIQIYTFQSTGTYLDIHIVYKFSMYVGLLLYQTNVTTHIHTLPYCAAYYQENGIIILQRREEISRQLGYSNRHRFKSNKVFH